MTTTEPLRNLFEEYAEVTREGAALEAERSAHAEQGRRLAERSVAHQQRRAALEQQIAALETRLGGSALKSGGAPVSTAEPGGSLRVEQGGASSGADSSSPGALTRAIRELLADGRARPTGEIIAGLKAAGHTFADEPVRDRLRKMLKSRHLRREDHASGRDGYALASSAKGREPG